MLSVFFLSRKDNISMSRFSSVLIPSSYVSAIRSACPDVVLAKFVRDAIAEKAVRDFSLSLSFSLLPRGSGATRLRENGDEIVAHRTKQARAMKACLSSLRVKLRAAYALTSALRVVGVDEIIVNVGLKKKHCSIPFPVSAFERVAESVRNDCPGMSDDDVARAVVMLFFQAIKIDVSDNVGGNKGVCESLTFDFGFNSEKKLSRNDLRIALSGCADGGPNEKEAFFRNLSVLFSSFRVEEKALCDDVHSAASDAAAFRLTMKKRLGALSGKGVGELIRYAGKNQAY